MKEFSFDPSLRLSTGGLFYRLLLLLRLVEKNRYRPWRSIVLFSGLSWLPLFILTAIDGTLTDGSVSIPFLQDPVPHVRCLIALPLLVFAEWFIDPYVANIIRHFQISGLVPDDAKPDYHKAIDKLFHRRDSAWADAVIFGVSFGLVWSITQSGLSSLGSESSSWILTYSHKAADITPAGWWFILVSIPLILFILFRWVWRLIIWIRFMNSVSRLPLAIQPTHPDRVGGLGLLTRAQVSFGVIFMAIGAMMSSSLSTDIIHSGRALSAVQLEVVVFVLVCFVVITGPLCTFSNQLINAKRREQRHYSALAFQMSETFRSKWLGNNTAEQGRGIITAVDPSAMADYSVIYETISTMRLIPLTKQVVIWLILLLLGPFLPLIFTQISLKEAFQRLAQTLV